MVVVRVKARKGDTVASGMMSDCFRLTVPIDLGQYVVW